MGEIDLHTFLNGVLSNAKERVEKSQGGDELNGDKNICMIDSTPVQELRNKTKDISSKSVHDSSENKAVTYADVVKRKF